MTVGKGLNVAIKPNSVWNQYDIKHKKDPERTKKWFHWLLNTTETK